MSLGSAKSKGEQKIKTCALCNAPIDAHSLREGIHAFCCAGCQAVFSILSTKNQLENFEQNPIFIQALRSGLISNPALLEHIQKQRAEIPEGEREKLHLEVTNMWCPSCAELIRLILLREKGVINCVVDYATDLASIEFSPRCISKERLFEIITELGYSPRSLDDSARHPVSLDLYIRFAVAAFCALNVMMFAYPLYATYFDYDGEGYGSLFAWLSMVLSLPVLFYSGWPIWRRFLSSFKVGFFGMEALVAIGVWSAFGLSVAELISGETRVYFDSMTVIVAFVLLGKIIEARAKFSAKESLLRLTRSTPRRGRKLFPDGSLQFVPIKEIAKGDVLVSYTGEKISLDGVVVHGQGACDESLMTGESMPVTKTVDKGVLGGTILVQGHLEYRVTNDLEEMALYKIIEMVEQDIGHKSIYVRAADRIVRWFVPIIVSIAIVSGVIYFLFPSVGDLHPAETAWLRALAVLLISCPCAIGIAAPAAESYLLNALAALGAIVRNRGCLQYLGREGVVVFDKTGTVTEGLFKVHSGIDHLSQNEKQALYNLSRHSTHPIAVAIAQSTCCEMLNLLSVEEVVGHGLKGIIDDHFYCLGSSKFMNRQGVEIPEKRSLEGTSVYFAKDGSCLAELILGDQVKRGMSQIVSSLKPAHTILLSGDEEATVAAVAKACQFDSWRASCTPLEKREFIEALRNEGKIVCMIGDGINDAPALTASHVGVSVVSASDMSIQVSDILLTTDNLAVLSKMRSLAMRGQKIVSQNLFWAFFYNVIGVGLAVFGILSPIFAAFAMSVSSLTVLFNARRLKQKR